jgi:hypothetical protein
MGKEKKIDSAIRIMMGDTRDVAIRIMKYKYPDLTMMMINFLLELARAVEMNNKLAVSINGVSITTEHNIGIHFPENVKVKLITDSPHDDKCSICGRPFVSEKGVFVRYSDGEETYKIALTKLAHMIYEHNAILPISLMHQMLHYFSLNIEVIRPISEWSKDELIREINSLRTAINLRSAVEEVAKVNPLAETTTEFKPLVLASAAAPNSEEVEVEEDDDSEEEAEIIEGDDDSDDDDGDEDED